MPWEARRSREPRRRPEGTFRHRAVRVEYQGHRFMQILAGLLKSLALGIGAGQLFYEGHIAFWHFHEYRR